MSHSDYRKIAIGSVVQLPFTARTVTGALVPGMEGAVVTVRIAGPTEAGPLVVTDAACVATSTGGYYEWDTTGLAPGRYYIQFSIDLGDLFTIEPVDPLSALLELRLGA